ncbi:MAG: YitT family protein [Bacteroidales bacterium]|nr:YitT family protein [Bacteroidales bacterium]
MSINFKKKERPFSKNWIKSYCLIILGCMLFAVGDVMFVNPYRLAPGGTYGLANVFNTLWPWRISYYALCMDIPLLIIGTWVLGPRFGAKTVFSTILISVFVWILESTWEYNPVIHDGLIENPAPGELGFVPDYFLNTLVAGLIYGLAIGLIFRAGATSGGSDIIAMLLNKGVKTSLGTLVLIVDSTISLTTFIAFKQARLPIYSILLIAIESKIIDIVVDGIKSYKTVFIISDHIEEIRQFIIVDLERGGTCFKGKGLYKGNEREMIYTTITRNEFVKLRSKIYDIDPNAFINVTNSSETIGEGFKALEKD